MSHSFLILSHSRTVNCICIYIGGNDSLCLKGKSTALQFIYYRYLILYIYIYIFVYIYIYIYILNMYYIYYIYKMKMQGFSNGFLKIKWKETQVNVINKHKSSEIHIAECIIKSSYYEKLLGIKIDLKLHFWWSCLRSM